MVISSLTLSAFDRGVSSNNSELLNANLVSPAPCHPDLITLNLPPTFLASHALIYACQTLLPDRSPIEEGETLVFIIPTHNLRGEILMGECLFLRTKLKY